MKLLVFSGSIRSGSYNVKLAAAAAKVAQELGAKVTHISLKDYDLPIYNGDLEASKGLPENCLKLKELFKSHDGVIISCPEYNSGITPLLKNTIDWISRPKDDETALECFKGKHVALLGASPGQLGGLRGLYHTRWVFQNIHSIVHTQMLALGNAMNAFGEEGSLVNEKNDSRLKSIVSELIKKLS